MNRFFHSVVLAAALILSTAYTSQAMDLPSAATMTTQKFEFISSGNRLSGFIDAPAGGAARAMIVIIHGYGKTDVSPDARHITTYAAGSSSSGSPR